MAQPPRTDTEWSSLASELLASIDSSSQNGAASHPVPSTAPELAQFIDHTLLKLDATPEQVDKLCEEAVKYGFKSVCVRLNFVQRCAQNLQSNTTTSNGSSASTPTPVIACVVGFHEGTYPTAEKVSEASSAVAAGASELDMVLNHASILAGEYSGAYHDVVAVRQAAPAPKTVLKVILETSQLGREQIVAASAVALAAGADFVKTSTGFNGHGATVEDVKVMKAVGVEMARMGFGKDGVVGKVKASGGVRSREDAVAMIQAGADRIGASSGVAIVSGMTSDAAY